MTPLARRPLRQSLRHRLVGRRSRMISATLALVLAGSMGASSPMAVAGDLEDQQAALRDEAARVQHSLEFVDGKIAQAAADLVLYQGQLPGAQQALLDAQGRVAGAVQEVQALAARVDLAQQNKAKITQQLDSDKQKIADTRKLIGQIATQAYKSGGVPSNLSLFFGSNQGSSLTDTINLADQALRSQNSAMDKLTQQSATNVNAQARLAAVEAEITDLKAKADAALAREKAARDEAEAKKAAVDKLIADTTRLDAQLQAAKPGIQSQLAKVKAQQDAVAAEIVERDRKLREAWLAEQRRIAEAAAAAARARGQATQPYVPPAQGSPSAFGLQHPFPGSIPITSGFGWRPTPPGTIDFYGQGGYMHTGIDFGAPCGTAVYAAAAGTVFSAGWANDGGGNNVKISHGVVQGNSLTTIYYHNTSVVVSAGQHVNRGQLIAYSGTTGNSTGCHSHFETWLNGRAVDPMNLL
ncbi:peptidoglycan DD-metalloendopeptidase family protein [Arthrobacter sp. ES3-54]|uniref:peptidoglycan DD-metalloendopeptidase family protein n=1 Tax=Arthrobacter sp. ES3-54 TaxID=1502991 RepID=UPI002404C9E0|nr:peptidoglycan DD-metalloendopeptidase family protein [Arthrobacter sp. ES3-54]MDF9748903.1 murein DD-endopeptidase MepM/ murein hydrolase activator NlpD [Arthrobacter sp. ES3-54]